MMSGEARATGWWALKLAAGGLLVALLAEHFLVGVLPAWPRPPLRLAQAVVVIGGLVTIGHYAALRRCNRCVARPAELVTRGGLFARVRHPMYLGDLLVYAGLALLAPGPATLAALGVGALAIVRQARLEDRWLARRFGDTHARWRGHTRLLLPGL